MTAKWLICNLGKDEALQNLCYGAQECGREAEIVPLREIAAIVEAPDSELKCVIPVGSIWGNSALRESRPNWVGNYHNKATFLCSTYYAYWGKYLTQKVYAFLPLPEIDRRIDWVYQNFGKDDCIFIRPDSGEKEFVGEVVHRERWRAWLEQTTNQLELTNQPKNQMSVVSRPENIDMEYRLIIADKKVVAGSRYRVAKHLSTEHLSIEDFGNGETQDIIRFAERVVNDNPPPLPPFFVLDIAKNEGGLSILEVGCFCCAGLYECDRRRVAEGVSVAAEKAFAERTREKE